MRQSHLMVALALSSLRHWKLAAHTRQLPQQLIVPSLWQRLGYAATAATDAAAIRLAVFLDLIDNGSGGAIIHKAEDLDLTTVA